MTTTTLASFSLLILLSTAPLAAAQSEATPRPSAQPAGGPVTTSATSTPVARTLPNPDYRLVAGDKLRI